MTVVDEEVDPLALERQVCFRAGYHQPRCARRVPAAAGIAGSDLSAIPRHAHAVGPSQVRQSGRPLSVKDIAAALQLDSATLSPMLKRLEALGLITRSRSTADERATDVELTKAGVQLRRRALKVPPAVVERLGVGLDELELLHAVLTRINAAALTAGALDNERHTR